MLSRGGALEAFLRVAVELGDGGAGERRELPL